MSNPNQTALGTGIGSALGIIKALITTPVVQDTIILAATGALVGFAVTELLKYIKRKITKKDE